MAKRIRYFYDEESCTFQEERVTPESAFKTVLTHISVSGLLACIGLAAYFFLYDDPKHLYLKNQNEHLQAKIRQLDGSLATLESQVNGLHAEDNRFYRSLMNADPINEGHWNGGTGGAITQPGTPADLAEAERRLERLSNKVQIQNQSYAYLFERIQQNKDYLRHVPAIKPVPGEVISGFGMRMHPIKGIRKMHTGLDMTASMGTPVLAAGDGVVRLSGQSRGGYGIQIEINHGGYGYITKYAHLSEVLVKKGQEVKRGDLIGYTGSTGLSKGPHLHYEVIRDGRKIDPIDYFYGDQTPEEIARLREAAKKDNESMD